MIVNAQDIANHFGISKSTFLKKGGKFTDLLKQLNQQQVVKCNFCNKITKRKNPTQKYCNDVCKWKNKNKRATINGKNKERYAKLKKEGKFKTKEYIEYRKKVDDERKSTPKRKEQLKKAQQTYQNKLKMII